MEEGAAGMRGATSSASADRPGAVGTVVQLAVCWSAAQASARVAGRVATTWGRGGKAAGAPSSASARR